MSARDKRLPILTGYASRRAAGVRQELQRRADRALAASRTAEDERFAAALRGKARGFREAVDLVRALESGRRIGPRRRFFQMDGGRSLPEPARHDHPDDQMCGIRCPVVNEKVFVPSRLRNRESQS